MSSLVPAGVNKNKKTFKPKVSSSRQKRQREGSDADHLAPKTQKLIASASSPSAATSKDRSQPDTDLITSSASLSKDRSQPANDLISSTAAPSNANSKDRSQPIATSKDSSPSASGQPKEPLQQNIEATNSLDVVSSIPTPTTSSCKRSQTQSTADLSKSTHKRQKKRPAAAVKIQEPQKPSTSAETPSSPAKTIVQPHQKATPEASAENFSTLLPSADASSSINTHPSSSGLYKCLEIYGTKFNLISMVIKTRTQKQVLDKFKREEKMNPNKTFKHLFELKKKFDPQDFERETGVAYHSLFEGKKKLDDDMDDLENSDDETNTENDELL